MAETASPEQDEEETPAESPKRRAPPLLNNFRGQSTLTAAENGIGEWFMPPDAMASSSSNSSALSGVLNASLSGPADLSPGVPSRTTRNPSQLLAGTAAPQILAPTFAASGYGSGDNSNTTGPNPWPGTLPQAARHEVEADGSRAGLRHQPNPY